MIGPKAIRSTDGRRHPGTLRVACKKGVRPRYRPSGAVRGPPPTACPHITRPRLNVANSSQQEPIGWD